MAYQISDFLVVFGFENGLMRSRVRGLKEPVEIFKAWELGNVTLCMEYPWGSRGRRTILSEVDNFEGDKATCNCCLDSVED